MSLDRFEHRDHLQDTSLKFSHSIARIDHATEELGETCRIFLSRPMGLVSLSALHSSRWSYAEAFLSATAANLEFRDVQPARVSKDEDNISLFSFLTDRRQAALNLAVKDASQSERSDTLLARHASKISRRPRPRTRFVNLSARFRNRYLQERAGICFGEDQNALLQRVNAAMLADSLDLEVIALEKINTQRYGSQE